MEKSPLFRPAALAGKRSAAYGEILLVRPGVLRLLTVIACASAAALVALFVGGSYTKHTTLRGTLVPARGMIDVRAPQAGTLIEKRVEEGARVAAGETLFVVSSERISRERGATQQAITNRLLERGASIRAQVEHTRELERSERAALALRLDAMAAEHAQVETAIASQRERLHFAEESAARYRAIQAQGFVAADQAAAKHEAALEQRARLQGLERELTRIARELGDARSALGQLEVTYAARIAELERAAGAAELEIAESEARRRILVVAPQSGIATAVTAQIGQAVAAGDTLMIVVPAAPRLHARVYAPSAAVGFVTAGAAVRLRYDAFAYQKFGHQQGVVASVARAPLPTAPSGLPAYVVEIALAQQHVVAYGEPRALRAGMVVEADVLQETRRLYEWAFEPLLAARSKLH